MAGYARSKLAQPGCDALDPGRGLPGHGRLVPDPRQGRGRAQGTRQGWCLHSHIGRLLPDGDRRQDPDRDRRAGRALPRSRAGHHRHHSRHDAGQRARGAMRRGHCPRRADETDPHPGRRQLRRARRNDAAADGFRASALITCSFIVATWGRHMIRHLATILLLIAITGCTSKYRVDSYESPTARLDKQASFYVVLPKDGQYEEKTYQGSGTATANAVTTALLTHVDKVVTGTASGEELE